MHQSDGQPTGTRHSARDQVAARHGLGIRPKVIRTNDKQPLRSSRSLFGRAAEKS